VGLAAPYGSCELEPAWLKFLPKPGGVDGKVQIAMGFPMLATAVWLFKPGCRQLRQIGLWLRNLLVLIASPRGFLASLFSAVAARKAVALVIVFILLVGRYAFALENPTQLRAPSQRRTQPAREGISGRN